jgi:hypothetical protein
MYRLAIVAAVVSLCAGALSPMRANAQPVPAVYPPETVVCPAFPPLYPRGWELMVRRPCYYYYSPPYLATYPHRASVHVVHGVHRRYAAHSWYGVHRRPYLRPGWWW